MKKPEFTLIGPTEMCPGSSVNLALGNMKGFGRGKSDITWTILEDSKEKPQEIKNKKKVLIKPDITTNKITVSVVATNFLGKSSDVKTVNIAKIGNSSLTVDIIGPALIRADQPLKLKAKSKLSAKKPEQPNNLSKFLKI